MSLLDIAPGSAYADAAKAFADLAAGIVARNAQQAAANNAPGMATAVIAAQDATVLAKDQKDDAALAADPTNLKKLAAVQQDSTPAAGL